MLASTTKSNSAVTPGLVVTWVFQFGRLLVNLLSFLSSSPDTEKVQFILVYVDLTKHRGRIIKFKEN